MGKIHECIRYKKVFQLPIVNEEYKEESTGEKGTSYLKLNPKMHRDIGFYIY